MNKSSFILAISMLVLACNSKTKPTIPSFAEQQEKDTVSTPFNKGVSTSKLNSSVSVDSYTSSESKHGKMEEYDNMRGFDPAFEDDMDDNGMSRYMENDDDEGWD